MSDQPQDKRLLRRLVKAPENYVIPPPEPTTEEEAEALFREFQGVLLQTTIREAIRFCALLLPSGDAVTLVRETLAAALDELELTNAASAEAAGHSISTHRRSIREEYAASNFLLHSVWQVLDQAGEDGLDLEGLHQGLLRRHRNLTFDRLKEILPHYCRKKLIVLQRGRYYNVLVTEKETEQVERLQRVIPGIFQIMDGIRLLDPAAHVGMIQMECTLEQLASLRARMLEAVRSWMQEQEQAPPGLEERTFMVVVLSGQVRSIKTAEPKKGRRSRTS